MRTLLVVFLLVALTLTVGFGCGKKEGGEPSGKVPTEVKKAEAMDTTRMDSAMMESTMVDTAGEPQDTM